MSGFSGVINLQSTITGVVDVAGVPTDASVAATGAVVAAGMLARDNTTQLVYARTATGTWGNLLPLTAADHSQLINLTSEDHPQYRKFLIVSDSSFLSTATQGQHKFVGNRNTPMYADGTSWMALVGGQERFATRTGAYYGPMINTSGSTIFTGTGLQRAAPWFLYRRSTFDQLLLHTNTAVASSTARPGIWIDSGQGTPGSRIVDGGVDLNANVANSDLAQSVSFTLDPGLYWVGAICQGGPDLRAVNSQNNPFATFLGADTFSNFGFAGYSRTVGTTGANTDPFGAGTLSSAIPAVRLRST